MKRFKVGDIVKYVRPTGGMKDEYLTLGKRYVIHSHCRVPSGEYIVNDDGHMELFYRGRFDLWIPSIPKKIKII